MWARLTRASICVAAGACLLILVGGTPIVRAVDAVVAQAFKAEQELSAGTLVARSEGDNEKVVKATVGNRALLAGVVVDKSDSFVTYDYSTGGVQVATGGVVMIDVTTLSGDISTGDQLTVSELAGFASRAIGPGKIVGHALQDFNKKTAGAQVRTVSDDKGRQIQVGLGSIPVSVGVADWTGTVGVNPIVEGLQSTSSQLAGKQVSGANAIIAAIVLGMGVLVSGIVLFSSVSSSIRSLGRNPLSHATIHRSLTQVILVVVALLGASLGIAYLIIRR